MRTIKIEAKIQVYDSPEEVSPEDQALLTLAYQQTKKAYAPYSNFYVGAALRMQNGETFTGNNQENAAYPMCLCGERVALFTAGNAFPNQAIEVLAIVVTNPQKNVLLPAAPCGACRQVISEFEARANHPIRILLKGDSPLIYEVDSIDQLLPLGFNAEFLEKRNGD